MTAGPSRELLSVSRWRGRRRSGGRTATASSARQGWATGRPGRNGGRGAPYRFGSRTSGSRGHGRTHLRLEQALREMFPAAAGAAVTHRWGGVLGVPRDWMPSVGYDRPAGRAWAGGYVGDGVGCSALAGRTIADLVLGRDTERTTLPWVGHRSPRWEPEPLRWLGVRGMGALLATADATENRSGRPSRLAAVAGRLLGD